RPERAVAAYRPTDHRHATAGDRGDAHGARSGVIGDTAITAPPRHAVNRCIAAGSAIIVMALAAAASAGAGQVPGPATDPDISITPRDRVYVPEQFSTTVSVIDPADNRLLGVIRLGDPTPSSLSPLYRGQLLVHGLGFSPDSKT